MPDQDEDTAQASWNCQFFENFMESKVQILPDHKAAVSIIDLWDNLYILNNNIWEMIYDIVEHHVFSSVFITSSSIFL